MTSNKRITKMLVALLMIKLSSCNTQPKSQPEESTAQASSALSGESYSQKSDFAYIPTETGPGSQLSSFDFPDVPYVPTPKKVVQAMLLLGEVGKHDIVYDLGSGDGRIPILAAEKLGAKGVGVEINADLVDLAITKARHAKVEDRVQFIHQDLFEVDLSEATVVTLYLLPDVNLRLRPKLFKELKPGTRVVSHDFDMGEWEPKEVRRIGRSTVYLWIIPENVPDTLL